MDIRTALKDQYHGGLAMLAQCIELCPDELWAAPGANPESPDQNVQERSFWRIAFHNLFFTHLYMGQDEASFRRPSHLAVGKRQDFAPMWGPPWAMEAYELPVGTEACSRGEILEYLAHVDGLVDQTVDALDLDTDQSGFAWYKSISKLSHELMNLRHVQGHVGQLSELLMQHGIDTNWRARASRALDSSA